MHVGRRKKGWWWKWREGKGKDIEYFIEFLKNLQIFKIHEFGLTLKHMHISCRTHGEGIRWQEHKLKKNHHQICIFIIQP